MVASKEKKTVNQIVVENILSIIDEAGVIPWQMPYSMYNSFNWFTGNVYRGVNRLLLPQGEYLTFKQLCDYNKQKGTNYRVEKGKKWRIVVFNGEHRRSVSLEEVLGETGIVLEPGKSVVGANGVKYVWENPNSSPEKIVRVRRYSKVISYEDCVDPETGESLPSKVELGEVELTQENPKKVADDYFARENGLTLELKQGVIPSYNIQTDTLRMNPSHASEAEYYSTLFHEIAHSTMHPTRLNRIFPDSNGYGSEGYAKEECVVEIASALLCAETGIFQPGELQKGCYDRHLEQFVETGKLGKMSVAENQAAYVSGWKRQIREWETEFVSLVNKADQAFYYILGSNPYESSSGGQR